MESTPVTNIGRNINLTIKDETYNLLDGKRPTKTILLRYMQKIRYIVIHERKPRNSMRYKGRRHGAIARVREKRIYPYKGKTVKHHGRRT